MPIGSRQPNHRANGIGSSDLPRFGRVAARGDVMLPNETMSGNREGADAQLAAGAIRFFAGVGSCNRGLATHLAQFGKHRNRDGISPGRRVGSARSSLRIDHDAVYTEFIPRIEWLLLVSSNRMFQGCL